MPDLSRQKALVDRILGKWGSRGTVTVTSTALDAPSPVQTANVIVRLGERIAEPGKPVRITATLSRTPFPVDGGQLAIADQTYDIVEATQKGLGNEAVIQFVVLHER